MAARPPVQGRGRRLAANTILAAGGRIAVLALWVGFTPPILRQLGPAMFGLWSLFLALTGYLTAFDFGLAQGTLRFVAAARGDGDHAAAGAHATLAVLGYLALALAWLGACALLAPAVLSWLRIPIELQPVARSAFQLGGLVFAVMGLAAVTISVVQGHDRFDLANLIVIAMVVLQALGIVWVLTRGGGLRELIINMAIAWAGAALLGFVLIRAQLPGFRWGSPRQALAHWPEALRFGGPMQATNVLSALHAQIDKLLLSRYVALTAVASYELGARVAVTAGSLPQLLLLSAMPEASALHAAGDRTRLLTLYQRGSRFFLAAAAVLLAPVVVAANRLYACWLGAPHPDAALVLRGLAIAMLLSLFTGMGTTLARAIGRTDIEAVYTAIAVGLHVGLSVWWVPRFGLIGALFATLIGNAIGCVAFVVLFARTLGWPLLGQVVRPFALPSLALALGVGAGFTVERAFGTRFATGSLWGLALVTGGAVAVAAATVLISRYVRVSEVRELLGSARSRDALALAEHES